jgi:large subunit ribosomal protein L18e
MKRTGPTKLSTRLLITGLEKKAIKEKQKIWKTIAEKLSKPSRQRIEVKVSKISFFAGKYPEKTFIIAGKVIGNEAMKNKAKVIALNYSESAKKEITQGKGEAVLLKEAVGKKFDSSKLMIVA